MVQELKLCAKGMRGGSVDFDLGCFDRLIREWTRRYPSDIVESLVEGIDKDVLGGVGPGIKDAAKAVEGSFQKVINDAMEANEFVLRTSLRMGMILDRTWEKMKVIAGKDAKGVERSMSEALGAILVGDYFGATGVRNSIAARKKAMADNFHGALFNDMKKYGVWRQLKDGGEAFQRQVANELWNIQGEVGEFTVDMLKGTKREFIKETDSDALKAAKIIFNIQQELIGRQNRLGARIKPLPGYIVKQSHDARKISGRGVVDGTKRAIEATRRTFGDNNMPKDTLRAHHAAARETWVNEMLNRLDLERTFPNYFKTDWEAKPNAEGIFPKIQTPEQVAAVKNILEDIFEDLSRGQHFNRYLKSGIEPEGIGRNIAANLSKARELHFKSAEDWFEYNKKYGVGDMFSALSTGLDRAAENIAMMEQLGPVPEVTYQALKSRIKASAKRGFDIKDLELGRRAELQKLFGEDFDKWQAEFEKSEGQVRKEAKTDKFVDREKASKFGEYLLDAFFNEVSGRTRIPASNVTARVASGIRAWNVLSKLGGAAISALADTPIIARETVRQGGTWLDGYGLAIKNLFEKFTRPEDQKALAESLGFGVEAIRNSMLSRLTAVDSSTPQRLRSLQNKLFRYTGMELWNDAHKEGMALWTSNRLGNLADR